MFEMYKYILDKVSFDESLFRKELLKAVEQIHPNERHSLETWCLSTFYAQHPEILTEVFRASAVDHQNEISMMEAY